MSEAWKRWEGHVVNGEFPLLEYLGESERAVVFLTQLGSAPQNKAVIKLVTLDPARAASQLSRWDRAAKLDHPGLIRIFEAGRCQLDGGELLYVVTEYAEENLGQILPLRPLTPSEAEAMLKPVVGALAFIHNQGWVHGRLKPSNILAIQDQVKISSDSLRPLGESELGERQTSPYDAPEAANGATAPASDIWSLGMTLVEALTQRTAAWNRTQPGPPAVPELPKPFLEIARHCLQVDAAERWPISEVAAQLEPKPAKIEKVLLSTPAVSKPLSEPVSGPISETKRSSKWLYWAPLAAVVVGIVIWAGSRTPTSNAPAPSTAAEQQETPTQTPANGEQPAAASDASGKHAQNSSGTGIVVHQVLPAVSRQAQHTIQGKLKVGVRVEVDAAGNVTQAALQSPGPSHYFARLSLEAARGWKFAPANDATARRTWILRFAFTRGNTDVVVEPVR